MEMAVMNVSDLLCCKSWRLQESARLHTKCPAFVTGPAQNSITKVNALTHTFAQMKESRESVEAAAKKWHPCLPAWMNICLPACLPACLPGWMLVNLPAWMDVSIPACLYDGLRICLPAWMDVCVPACLDGC